MVNFPDRRNDRRLDFVRRSTAGWSVGRRTRRVVERRQLRARWCACGARWACSSRSPQSGEAFMTRWLRPGCLDGSERLAAGSGDQCAKHGDPLFRPRQCEDIVFCCAASSVAPWRIHLGGHRRATSSAVSGFYDNGVKFVAMQYFSSDLSTGPGGGSTEPRRSCGKVACGPSAGWQQRVDERQGSRSDEASREPSRPNSGPASRPDSAKLDRKTCKLSRRSA